ncbi:hypothetical protein GOP47_0026356 [Adiantum capillus-veneris]|nr:hypothetical protein GOP47_0026356 [Adiantum capillus-veneris]
MSTQSSEVQATLGTQIPISHGAPPSPLQAIHTQQALTPTLPPRGPPWTLTKPPKPRRGNEDPNLTSNEVGSSLISHPGQP